MHGGAHIGFIVLGVMGRSMAGHLLAAGNALRVFARRKETARDLLDGGATGIWSLSHLAPLMLAGDFAPGFFVKHFIKDMSIAAAAAARMGFDLPGLDLALSLYRDLAGRGHENDGTQAFNRLYQKGE